MDKLSILTRRAQEGERDAFGEIYSLFYKKIYRYCQFHSESVELAQDICQETFLKAWKALPSFSQKKGGTLQAFLFKIARNLLIDWSRKKKESKLEQHLDLESNENLMDEIERGRAIKTVRTAIRQLDGLEQEIITLHYFEELSGAEIASVVGMNEGAVRVRTHRILLKLKEIIGEENA